MPSEIRKVGHAHWAEQLGWDPLAFRLLPCDSSEEQRSGLLSKATVSGKGSSKMPLSPCNWFLCVQHPDVDSYTDNLCLLRKGRHYPPVNIIFPREIKTHYFFYIEIQKSTSQTRMCIEHIYSLKSSWEKLKESLEKLFKRFGGENAAEVWAHTYATHANVCIS